MSDPIPSWWRRHFASWSHPDQFTQHPWLKPLAGRLLHPSLWRLRHESVARGAAVGLFWAFVLPAGQIVAAVAHCSVWRANIPVAALMTLVTNPLTIGFWLWLAYHLGAWVLGAPAQADGPTAAGLSQWLSRYGWPALVGMATLAIGSAAAGYAGVKLVWRLRVTLQWRRRKLRP
ncbi:DUF2062 domain-containing protein [Curvibacter sp. HBC61]|uniref:DUF2062 domain-containing protein n=1 Tax=Curvibacter cyanobacteriorum TaxID=3026422 RepID=A0ABT5MYY9_9BURK|nr:DUF2062 domain-containing protein [Curvibacter sp. HBC61]MDD0837997.1 DUF2062 domain-containing protein [Curvibacter sp. HBC61]